MGLGIDLIPGSILTRISHEHFVKNVISFKRTIVNEVQPCYCSVSRQIR